MSFLTELKEKRVSLNHTSTKVTTLEGKTLLEEMMDGEHVSKALPDGNQSCPGFVIDTKPDLQVGEIIPSSLCLGSQDVTQDVELLRRYGITHILSLGVPVSPLPQLPNLSHSFIPALDLPDENIDTVLDEALTMIKETISQGGCVFVHCNAGVSRAPTVVTAFLMAHKGLTYDEAIKLVKEKRPASQPNVGFVKQLLAFERKLTKVNMYLSKQK